MFQTIPQALPIACQHHQNGRHAEALAIYQWILARDPNHAVALHLSGVLAAQMGNPQEGIARIRHAITLQPGEATFHTNLGMILESQGQLDSALPCYRQAVALAPADPDSHYRLGNAWRALGLMPLAIACFQQALRLHPTHLPALNNLGHALAESNRLDEALACCREVLRLAPQSAAAHGHLANHLKSTGQIHAAIAEYRLAMGLEPDNSQRHSSLIYALTLDPAADAATIREELARWNARHAAPYAPAAQRHLNPPDPDRPLRIGYVSADFRDHVVGRNLLPLFRHHDRAAFEIVCYSNSHQADQMTEQFRRLSDHFQVVISQSDEQMAPLIRNDQIDILVDLSLHTAGNRLGVFARRPAPVQATFAGYPGSTGLTAIDYRISDPFLDPPASDAADFVERTCRLGTSFWCYDSGGEEPPVGELPALSCGRVTFGCLNNFSKVNNGVLLRWSRVLGAVPGSRIMLLAPAGSHRQRVAELFGRHEIASDRIVFHAPCPRGQFLRLFHQIDIGLDTLPYNGHSTSLESLFMGVPVVTLVGSTLVGRAGLSQLTNLGLPELIARAPEEFVRIAVELAGDLPRLAKLRATLRERMRNSPLMDAPEFARGIEAAYRAMWRKWCAQERDGSNVLGWPPLWSRYLS